MIAAGHGRGGARGRAPAGGNLRRPAGHPTRAAPRALRAPPRPAFVGACGHPPHPPPRVFPAALPPPVLLYAFVGCVVGTIVGVLPGVGPLAGISLLLPATFGLDATKAIVMLAGIYYGAMYGGSTTSILMRIPGEAASVMTCIDGYAMARKGRAGAALAIAAVGSYVAGTVSIGGPLLLRA